MYGNRYPYFLLLKGDSGMKRIAILLLALMLLISLSGCTLEELGITKVTEPETQPTDPSSTQPADPTPSVPTAPVDKTITGTVHAETLNVREGLGTDYDVVSTLKDGQKIEILEMQFFGTSLWGRIDKGWLSLNYVILDDPTVVPLSKTDSFKGVALKDLNVRIGPGSQYTVTSLISKYDRLQMKGVCGNWALTDQGWINMGDIYVDGANGPYGTVQATVTGSAKFYTDPGSTDYTATCQSGDRIRILFSAPIHGVEWGCTEQGWIRMSLVKKDNDSAIYGYWYRWRNNGDGTYTIWVNNYSRNGKCTCTAYTYDRQTNTYVKAEDQTGLPGGSYSFDGKTLQVGSYTSSATVKSGKLIIGSVTYASGDVKSAVKNILQNG